MCLLILCVFSICSWNAHHRMQVKLFVYHCECVCVVNCASIKLTTFICGFSLCNSFKVDSLYRYDYEFVSMSRLVYSGCIDSIEHWHLNINSFFFSSERNRGNRFNLKRQRTSVRVVWVCFHMNYSMGFLVFECASSADCRYLKYKYTYT